MNVIGEIGEDDARIAARGMLLLDFPDRPRRIARHDRIEEIDHPRTVGKAEHRLHLRRLYFAFAMGKGLIEKRQRIAHRSFRSTRNHSERIVLSLDAFEPGDLAQMRDKQRRIEALQIEALAARQDGDGNFPDLGGREEEFHMRRRFLERLQQRIEGTLRQHVDFVDDIDLVAGSDRGIAHRLDDLAHIVDARIRCGVHFDNIDVAGLKNCDAICGELRHIQGRPARIVERPRDKPRRRGLADAAHAREHIGLRDSPGREGVGERAHHRLLADEVGENPRTVFAGEDAIAG